MRNVLAEYMAVLSPAHPLGTPGFPRLEVPDSGCSKERPRLAGLAAQVDWELDDIRG